MIDKEKLDMALLRERKIYLKGRIDREQVDKIADMVLLLDNQDANQEITLYIKSKGGNIGAGFDLYDILRHVKSPLQGLVLREACSMAILALQACDSRMMMDHAVLGFHDIDVDLYMSWRGFLDVAKKRVELAEKEQEDYASLIASRAGIGIKQIIELCEQNKILSACESWEMGLIDEII